jgi:DNA primase
MALLIQNPSLVDHLDSRATGLLVEGHPHGGVLKAVVEFLHSHPHVTPAGLLEGMREHPEGDLVARLSAWDSQVAEDQVEPLFSDYLNHLTGERSRESRLKSLIDKARSGALTAEEREELRALTLQGGH